MDHLDEYYNKFPCKRCGRVGVQKDIEGAIHHNTGVVCLDQKDCRKARRRAKRTKRKCKLRSNNARLR